MTVYSVSFIYDTPPSGFSQIWVPPAVGDVAILRDLEVNYLGVAVGLSWLLEDDLGNDLFGVPSFNGPYAFQWTGRMVIPTGRNLYFQGNGGDVFCSLSGYALKT